MGRLNFLRHVFHEWSYKKIFAITAPFYLIIVSISFFYSYQSHKKTLENSIDFSLKSANGFYQELYPVESLSKLSSEHDVSPEDYLQKVVNRNNKLCKKLKIQYLWSVVQVGDDIHFTTSTSSNLTLESQTYATYWSKHSDPQAFALAFENMSPTFSSFKNKWGHGRMLLVPFIDQQGRKGAWGASIEFKHYEHILWNSIIYEIIGVLIYLFGAFGLTIVLISLVRISEQQRLDLKKIQTDLIMRFNEMEKVTKCGGWSYDIKNEVLYWSPMTYDIHEVDQKKEVIVEEAINYYAPYDRQKVLKLFELCCVSGEDFDTDSDFISKKGNKRRVRSTGQAIRNTQGEIILVYGIFQDVTNYYSLSEQNKMYEYIIKNSDSPIAYADKNFTIEYVNPAYHKLYGLAQGDSLLKNASNRNINLLKNEIIPTALEKGSWFGNVERVSAEGKRVFAQVNVFTSQNERGELVRLFSTQSDTTEINKLAKKNHDLLQDLEHRVKNNFQVIISLIRLMEQKASNFEVKTILKDLDQRIFSMSLIHDKLISRYEGENIKIKTHFDNILDSLKSIYNRQVEVTSFGTDESIIKSREAIYLGLILTELFSNSMKHVDNNQELKILYAFSYTNNQFQFIYQDIDHFYKKDINSNILEGFGIDLISTFVEGLNGTFEYKSTESVKSIFPQIKFINEKVFYMNFNQE